MIIYVYLAGVLITTLIMTYVHGRKLFDDLDIFGSFLIVIMWPLLVAMALAFAVGLLILSPFIFLYTLGKKHSS